MRGRMTEVRQKQKAKQTKGWICQFPLVACISTVGEQVEQRADGWVTAMHAAGCRGEDEVKCKEGKKKKGRF